jgi:mevalonate kinase
MKKEKDVEEIREIGKKVGKLLSNLEQALKEKDFDKFDSISNEIHRISDNEGLTDKEYNKWDSLREKERKYQSDKYWKKNKSKKQKQ